eukprot:1150580-Pelagomonas_calceolata.AAC.6
MPLPGERGKNAKWARPWQLTSHASAIQAGFLCARRAASLSGGHVAKVCANTCREESGSHIEHVCTNTWREESRNVNPINRQQEKRRLAQTLRGLKAQEHGSAHDLVHVRLTVTFSTLHSACEWKNAERFESSGAWICSRPRTRQTHSDIQHPAYPVRCSIEEHAKHKRVLNKVLNVPYEKHAKHKRVVLNVPYEKHAKHKSMHQKRAQTVLMSSMPCPTKCAHPRMSEWSGNMRNVRSTTVLQMRCT